jgi:hypothetical protein
MLLVRTNKSSLSTYIVYIVCQTIGQKDKKKIRQNALFLCLTGETKKSMEGLGFVLFDAFVYTGA